MALEHQQKPQDLAALARLVTPVTRPDVRTLPGQLPTQQPGVVFPSTDAPHPLAGIRRLVGEPATRTSSPPRFAISSRRAANNFFPAPPRKSGFM